MADHLLKRVIALTLTLALMAFPAFAQSVEDGLDAAQKGDPVGAIAIWAPLAEAGDAEAQYRLAETHWGGWWDVPENPELVAYWHGEAAKQGYAPSFVKLGHMYAAGNHFAQDDATAAKWYALAADAGEADGQYFLANAYYDGTGVPGSYTEAMILWRKAFEQGHEGARAALCGEVTDYCIE